MDKKISRIVLSFIVLIFVLLIFLLKNASGVPNAALALNSLIQWMAGLTVPHFHRI